ncbi:MAG: tripartite tricarboxylate transporter permease [Hyphomicrobiaceae bacterium]
MFEQLLILLADPVAIGVAFGSVTLGVILGALPGLTGPMAMALLIGVSYSMKTEYAIVSMMLIYMAGAYGGSMSAILLNVPGAPASAATALDGYPLARKGHAGRAIAMATIGSCIGSMMAVGAMATLTPWLVEVSLLFTSWELLLLVILGIVMAGGLSGDDPLKGLIAGALGLMLAMVGLDDLHTHPRFTFGSTYLQAGFALIAAIVGLFGISQVIVTMAPKDIGLVRTAASVGRVIPRWADIRGKFRVIFQSGIIGTFVGILPGLGADVGGWAAYGAAKRASKEPEEYGKGSIEGVTAAETGNNAVIPGSFIPMIALGLPGSAGAAIVMAALFVHGMKPGPTFLIDNLQLFEYMVAGLMIGTVVMLIVGLLLAHVIVHVLLIPRENIMAVVVALAVIGAYASQLQYGDVWMMMAFGVLAVIMRTLAFPLAPLILGLVLGKLFDEFLRNSLIISDGSLMPIVQRPIAFALAIIVVLSIVFSIPAVQRGMSSLISRSGAKYPANE